MAATPWHDWDRRIIGWFLVALIVLAHADALVSWLDVNCGRPAAPPS